MLYFLLPAAVIVGILIVFIMLSGSPAPDFLTLPLMPDDDLMHKIHALSKKTASYESRGRVFSLSRINRFFGVFRRLSKSWAKDGLFDFEIVLAEALGAVRGKLKAFKQQSGKLQELPHFEGLPRIIHLCRLITKAGQGFVTAKIFKQAVEEFNTSASLTYHEIKALPLALIYSLSEFLAVYYNMSSELFSERKAALKDVRKRRINLSLLGAGTLTKKDFPGAKNTKKRVKDSDASIASGTAPRERLMHEGVISPYIYFFISYSENNTELSRAFKQVCEKNDIDLSAHKEDFIRLVSGFNGAAAAAYKTLSGLSGWMKGEFLIQLSELNKLLESEQGMCFEENAGLVKECCGQSGYALCPLDTKDMYLEHIARAAKKAEKKASRKRHAFLGKKQKQVRLRQNKPKSENVRKDIKQGTEGTVAALSELALGRELIESAYQDGVELSEKILNKTHNKARMFLFIAVVFLGAALLCGIAAVFGGRFRFLAAVLSFPAAVGIVLLLGREFNIRLGFKMFTSCFDLNSGQDLTASISYLAGEADYDDINCECFFGVPECAGSKPSLSLVKRLALNISQVTDDWQSAPYLIKKSEAGERKTKLVIFFRLFFSLLPVFTIVLLVLAAFDPQPVRAVLIALSYNIAAALNVIRASAKRLRLFAGAFFRIVALTALLPFIAFCNITAICTAFFRLLKRKEAARQDVLGFPKPAAAVEAAEDLLIKESAGIYNSCVSTEEKFVPCIPVRYNFFKSGRYVTVHGSGGEGRIKYKDVNLSGSESLLGGLRVLLKLNSGGNKNVNGKIYDINSQGGRFEIHKTTYEFRSEELAATVEAVPLADFSGELRRVRLLNTSYNEIKCTLFLGLELNILGSTENKDGMLIFKSGCDKMPVYLGFYFLDEGVEYGTDFVKLLKHSALSDIMRGEQHLLNDNTDADSLAAKKEYLLKSQEETEILIYLFAGDSPDKLSAYAKSVKSHAYFFLAEQTGRALARYKGISRITADLGSAVLCASFVNEAGFKEMPVVFAKTDLDISRLSKLQQFVDFSIVQLLCGEAARFADSEFSGGIDSGPKNYCRLDKAKDAELIKRLKKIAVEEPVNFMPLKKYEAAGIDKAAFVDDSFLLCGVDAPDCGNGVLLREADTVWSVTGLIRKGDYTARHGLGYDEFSCKYNDILAHQTEFSGTDIKASPIKYSLLALKNTKAENREVEATFYANLDGTKIPAGFVDIQFEDGGIKAENRQNGKAVFICCNWNIAYYVSHNMKYFERSSKGESLFNEFKYSKIVKAPYAAVSVKIKLKPYEEAVTVFSLGAPPEGLSNQLVVDKVLRVFEKAKNFYKNLSCFEVDFFDEPMNSLLGGLPYFFYSGRDLGRGNAESLLDDLALLYISPSLLKDRILKAAADYSADEQAASDYSLPVAAAEYIGFTKDLSLFSAPVAGLSFSLYRFCLSLFHKAEKSEDAEILKIMQLYYAVCRFIHCVKDSEERSRLTRLKESLKKEADKVWTGEWFAQANEDTVLNMQVQAWAALSNITDSKKAKIALRSVAERLIDYKKGGFIKGFTGLKKQNVSNKKQSADLSGVISYISALIKAGFFDFAYSLLEMINPFNHGHKDFVLSCNNKQFWMWDSGAAGHYYKCIIESVLGLKVQKDRLYFAPALPAKIKKIKVKFKTGIGCVDIEIDNTGSGHWCVRVDKVKYNVNYILITPSVIGKKVVIKRD